MIKFSLQEFHKNVEKVTLKRNICPPSSIQKPKKFNFFAPNSAINQKSSPAELYLH